MALNQFKHNHPEPAVINDINMSGTLTGAAATITSLTVAGPIVVPNVLNGNYTIARGFNGILPGPIDIQGSINVEGILVVV